MKRVWFSFMILSILQIQGWFNWFNEAPYYMIMRNQNVLRIDYSVNLNGNGLISGDYVIVTTSTSQSRGIIDFTNLFMAKMV